MQAGKPPITDAEFVVISEGRLQPPAPKLWTFWGDDFPALAQIAWVGVLAAVLRHFIYLAF